MKLVRTQDAVGHVLCHDITQIIKDVSKGPVFKKGHIVTEEDIPVLLSVGKENLYIWEKEEGMLHENEGAEILRQLSQGSGMHPSDVSEGKIELIADMDGLLKVDTEGLNRINSIGELMIASRHGNFPVKKGDKIAGMRVIPLVISEERMNEAKRAAGDHPLFEILPYRKRKVGIVTTGSEVFYGRIRDTFTPVIREKLREYRITEAEQILCNDEMEMITEAIQTHVENGCDMILCTGGMSVDPDDRTPAAIKASGARIVTYGAPVLPGAMFMLAYMENDGRSIPIMGLPGCVMYAGRTIFDLVLPRVLCGEQLTAEDIHVLGQGGLCLSCPVCTFPNCGFGKGVR